MILFVSPRKSRLVYSEMNNFKKWIIIVYVSTICCDLFNLFFESCRERRQSLFCGQKRSLSLFQIWVLFFDYIQLALNTGITEQLKMVTTYSFFLLGNSTWSQIYLRKGVEKECRVEIGTWGSQVNNTHLRHVTSRAISWRIESEIQKVWTGGRASPRKEDREKDWYGERGTEHTWPLRYSVVFQTQLWKNRGTQGQSITALACSYKAFSLCGPPPCLPHSTLPAQGDRSEVEIHHWRELYVTIQAFVNHQSIFSSVRTAYLHASQEGGGVTDVTGAGERGFSNCEGGQQYTAKQSAYASCGEV